MPARKKVTASKAVAKRKSTSMVDIQAEIERQRQELTNQINAGSSPIIKIDQDAGEFFDIPAEGTVEAPLDLVIVDFVSTNKWWSKKYKPGVIEPPDCFAIGRNPDKLIPSPNGSNIQAESCSACPLNMFGSNGEGKECKNNRLLAVLPPSKPDDDIHLISVSPTGLKSFDNYIRGLSAITVPCAVRTTFNIVKSGGGKGFTLGFNLREHVALDQELAVAFFNRQSEARTLLTQEPQAAPADAPSAPVRGRGRKKVAARRR